MCSVDGPLLTSPLSTSVDWVMARPPLQCLFVFIKRVFGSLGYLVVVSGTPTFSGGRLGLGLTLECKHLTAG